jgi:hypothetical protein
MRRSMISVSLAGLMFLIWPATALAATDPGLTATLASFGVLAGTTVTNTGPSWITGAVGVSPGLAITGFPGANGATSGPQFTGAGSLAGTAETDWVTANNGLSQPNTTDYTNVNLGGLTLGPGVYNQTTVAALAGINLTGTLTLNGPGIYIFKVGSTLTTAAGAPGAPAARVVLINGAQPCDIFWQVPTQATIATYTAFIGTILAGTQITMNTGATLWGRALAHTAQVTLDTNRIIVPSGCTTGLTPNFAAPAPVASPSGNTAPPLPVVLPLFLGVIVTAPAAVLPGNTGVPLELRGQFPWLLLIGVGAGLGATAMGITSRRRRRRNA